MGLADAANVARLKQWLADVPADMDPFEDTLEELLQEAQELMEHECGRIFEAEGLATTVYPRVTGGRVPIWDVMCNAYGQDLPTVHLDLDGDEACERELTYLVDYTYHPYSDPLGRWQDVEGVSLRGAQYLDRVPTSAVPWPEGALVKVLGQVGYGESGWGGHELYFAAVLMAARLWGRRQTPLAQVAVAEGDADRVLGPVDPEYERIVQAYRHPHLTVPA